VNAPEQLGLPDLGPLGNAGRASAHEADETNRVFVGLDPSRNPRALFLAGMLAHWALGPEGKPSTYARGQLEQIAADAIVRAEEAATARDPARPGPSP
jgi:hypothetical protein